MCDTGADRQQTAPRSGDAHTDSNYTDFLRLKSRVILSQGELSLVH